MDSIAIVILCVAVAALITDCVFRLDENFVRPVRAGFLIGGALLLVNWAIWQIFF